MFNKGKIEPINSVDIYEINIWKSYMLAAQKELLQKDHMNIITLLKSIYRCSATSAAYIEKKKAVPKSGNV